MLVARYFHFEYRINHCIVVVTHTCDGLDCRYVEFAGVGDNIFFNVNSNYLAKHHVDTTNVAVSGKLLGRQITAFKVTR